MARPLQLLLTCEHAGNRVPREFAPLFAGCGVLLASHRGWDPGSLSLGRAMAAALDAPLVYTDVTRLLVEPNRSPRHRDVYSRFTKVLPAAQKQRIIDRYYESHRARILEAIESIRRARGRALHVGVHTFTPELNGEKRNADIGLLYDPRRSAERTFCRKWKSHLAEVAPSLRVRLNYPYRGAADGLTTALRRRFRPGDYLGVELEVNQRLLKGRRPAFPAAVTRAIIASLDAAMA